MVKKALVHQNNCDKRALTTLGYKRLFKITTDLELSSKLSLKNAAPYKRKNMVFGFIS